jgi:hypothetical protein
LRYGRNQRPHKSNGKTFMDFFETWFGLSPDGGDGSTEMLWLGAIIVAVVAIAFRRRIMAALTAKSSKRP